MDDETERREISVPFGAGAYVLRYRLHDETIVVIRVWHSREARV
jgi:plasmid stabilization system protein ParE